MTTQYEKFLSTIPCFAGLHAQEMRIVTRLVDVLVIPAGAQLFPTKGEVIVAVQGETIGYADGSVLAVTPLRLLVFGRRELLSLFEQLPDLALELLLLDDIRAVRRDVRHNPRNREPTSTSQPYS